MTVCLHYRLILDNFWSLRRAFQWCHRFCLQNFGLSDWCLLSCQWSHQRSFTGQICHISCQFFGRFRANSSKGGERFSQNPNFLLYLVVHPHAPINFRSHSYSHGSTSWPLWGRLAAQFSRQHAGILLKIGGRQTCFDCMFTLFSHLYLLIYPYYHESLSF